MVRRRFWIAGAVCLLLLLVTLPVLAAEAGSGGYLSGYENADPRPSQLSWWSTLAYLVSLFAVFAFVVVMAYFASKFLSGHFAKAAAGNGGRILANLALGPNRSVCVVELADRVFMLGVTEHSITLLREVTDAEEIERLVMDEVQKDQYEWLYNTLYERIREGHRRRQTGGRTYPQPGRGSARGCDGAAGHLHR